MFGEEPLLSVEENSQIADGNPFICGFPVLLHGRQQQPYQDRDNRNNHQQLNQREPGL
jgi:hypothetical protein